MQLNYNVRLIEILTTFRRLARLFFDLLPVTAPQPMPCPINRQAR